MKATFSPHQNYFLRICSRKIKNNPFLTNYLADCWQESLQDPNGRQVELELLNNVVLQIVPHLDSLQQLYRNTGDEQVKIKIRNFFFQQFRNRLNQRFLEKTDPGDGLPNYFINN